MKIFISQYMGGRSNEEILKERLPVEKMLKTKGYEIIDSIIEELPPENISNIATWYIAKSLELLSQADVIYFMKGWQQGSGCKIERQVAEEYGIDILEQ